MNNVLDFLDNCFGSWFEPQRTFEKLALDPPLVQAVVVVVLVNILEGLRLWGLWGAFLQPLFGLVGWAVLGGLVWSLLQVLGQSVSYLRLLTLTGFASLPWLLVPPLAVLGGPVGGLVILGLLLWFVILQTWAVTMATALDWWRVALLIPLAFVGALLALNWLANSLITTSGLMN